MSSPSPMVTLSDSSVHHVSAGRSTPSCLRYLVLIPDHPPPHSSQGRAAAGSGIALKRSLERSTVGVMEQAPLTWLMSGLLGKGDPQSWGCMGRRAGNSPCSPRTNPVPKVLQSCPSTAPSLTPRVPHGVQGQE